METNNILLTKESLQDYTWQELKLIADDLSENGKESQYYSRMLYLTQQGSTKTFKPCLNTYDDKFQVRIIGLCHDVKAEDGTLAGLTFQFTHAFKIPNKMLRKCKNNCWDYQNARVLLNSSIYEELPDSLKNNIVTVKHEALDIYRGNVSYEEDKLFILRFENTLKEGRYFCGRLKYHNYLRSGPEDETYEFYKQGINKTGIANMTKGLTERSYGKSVNQVYLGNYGTSYRVIFINECGITEIGEKQLRSKQISVVPAFCF